MLFVNSFHLYMPRVSDLQGWFEHLYCIHFIYTCLGLVVCKSVSNPYTGFIPSIHAIYRRLEFLPVTSFHLYITS